MIRFSYIHYQQNLMLPSQVVKTLSSDYNNTRRSQMYGTIQVRLNVPDPVRDYLVYQCQQANKLINCATYIARQLHFEQSPKKTFFVADEFRVGRSLGRVKTAGYYDLWHELKENPHYVALGGQPAQQVLKGVAESFSSYNALLKLFFAGEGEKPRLPGYRSKDGLAPITYPAQHLKFNLETGECRLPVSNEVKGDLRSDFDISEIWINGCYSIKPEQIKEVRILPKNQTLYAEYVYEFGNDGPTCALGLDPHQALGIDHGLGNWLTCVSTLGKSFLIDGAQVKSANQWYNKRIAELKTGQPQGYWSPELARITEERNCFMRDAVNKTARFIVNHCLENRIGVIVFGWNKGQKNGINLGSQNNQSVVQVPTGRLKERLRELCAVHGIQYIETEESYTSQSSFLDGDLLPTFGEKPKSWKPSGKRITRGQYKTAQGFLINADCNGA
ncbi:MAG: IS200/IS605 family element transposase accessory protein TnpB, partial [Cyanobacteria bacterium RI_101]|nr:IS200/IS605 family element transposase accessory protein TnpB [Cyanobacteria bacterium RI_101]